MTRWRQPMTNPNPSPPVAPFAVPYPQNRLFVGRETELARLEALLSDGHTPALTGPGGMGKTQVAVEAAYRLRDQYPGGVFWLTMEQAESIPIQVAALAA